MRPIPILAVLLSLALAAPAAAQHGGRGEGGPGGRGGVIVVVGEGRVEAAPDRATVTVGVESEAARASEAMAATAQAMQAVFAALEEEGLRREDMQTSELSVNPVWDGGGEGRAPQVRGYVASNLVAIRVRDLDRLGAVLDAVGASGANRVQGIAFERSNAATEQERARRRAVADARARAETLAEAAGVELGRIRSIREAGEPRGPGPMMMRAEAAMDMPVAEGVVGVESRVEIVFAIR